jgi:hypothetical protein
MSDTATRVVADLGHGSYLIEGVTADGTPYRAFQCNCSEEAQLARMAEADYDQYAADKAEHERSLLGLDDPNRCDSRRVRRELGDRLVNLGGRVNRVPARAVRF